MNEPRIPAAPVRLAQTRRLVVAGFLLVLGAGAALRSIGFTASWEFGHRGVLGGGLFSDIVQTYERLGWAGTRGGMRMSAGGLVDPPLFYFHHPPLFAWLLVVARRLLGTAEWALRAPSYLFSLAALALAFESVRRASGPIQALVAAACFAVLPAGVVYGHFVSYEPMVLALALCAVVLLQRVAPDGRGPALLLPLLLLVAATMVDWPGYFYAPVLGILAARRAADRRGAWLAFLAFQGAALVGCALFFAYGAIASGGIAEFVRRFAGFAAEVGSGGLEVGPATWAGAVGRHLRSLFGIVPLVLLAAGIVLWCRDLRAPARREAAIRGLALLVPAVLNVTVFWRNACGHDFHAYYFLPSAAFAAARVGAAFSELVRPRWPRLAWAPGLALLAAAATECVPVGVRDLRRAQTTLFRELGEFVARNSGKDTLVLCNVLAPAANAYAGRGILLLEVRSAADLRPAAAMAREFGLRYREVAYVACDPSPRSSPLLRLLDPEPLTREGRFTLYRVPAALWDEAAAPPPAR